VVIHRDQHFLAANIGLTCASAPVYDPMGDLVAVLDVSTVRSDLGEAIAALVSHSVTEAARRIEADLFHASHPRARMVLVPGIDRGVGALLAVDADDHPRPVDTWNPETPGDMALAEQVRAHILAARSA